MNESERPWIKMKGFILAFESTRAHFYNYAFKTGSLRIRNVSIFLLSGRAFGFIVDDRRRVVLASESQNKLSKG